MDAPSSVAEECLIEQDPSKYFYVAQGMLTIDNVDDAEEMKATDDAMDVLGFNQVCFAQKAVFHHFVLTDGPSRSLQAEKLNLYRCTAAIMHFGNSQWKQRPREEQAEADGTEDCEKVAHLLGVEAADLIKGLLKPRIKVKEFVR